MPIAVRARECDDDGILTTECDDEFFDGRVIRDVGDFDGVGIFGFGRGAGENGDGEGICSEKSLKDGRPERAVGTNEADFPYRHYVNIENLDGNLQARGSRVIYQGCVDEYGPVCTIL